MPLKWIASLLALAASLAAGCDARPGKPQNLVVISLDTLRADHLGVYGYERETSPQLDRWAERAFVFDNALSAANYTLASHQALFQSRTARVAKDARLDGPTLAVMLKEQGFHTAAFTGGGMLTEIHGFSRGFDSWDEGNQLLVDTVPKALAFLDEAAREGGRFYLFVHCVDVHLPYSPPAPYNRLFYPEYTGTVDGEGTRKLLSVRKIFEGTSHYVRFDDADRKKVVALYDGEIAKMDVDLAKLLGRIDAPDLRDDTLVVIVSDHGDEFWDHGSVLHAHTVFQELLHVPFLLRVPALEREARHIGERVSLLDVVPTVLELLALPQPKGLRGRSLVPLLHGETLPERPVFAEGFAVDSKLQTVVDGPWKLIRDLDSGHVALFDLESDPQERNDLAPAQPQQVERLRQLLDGVLGRSREKQDPLALPAEVDEATKARLRELGYID
ncbi:MAG TPA: sulfatase [Myxococcota bacterium]|nr:sulfatase [Myxococcota bacterium]